MPHNTLRANRPSRKHARRVTALERFRFLESDRDGYDERKNQEREALEARIKAHVG